MTADRLQITSTVDGETCSLGLGGELDLATVDALKQSFAAALTDDPRSVVIDLGDLSFVDSTGLGAFVDFHHQCDEAGVGLRFTEVPDHVQRLMEITRLTELFDIA